MKSTVNRLDTRIGHMDVRTECTVLHSHCGVDMR